MKGLNQLLALVCLLFLATGHASAMATGTDEVFNKLLARYVVASADRVNRVDYKSWKANTSDHKRLKSYIGDLEARVPSKMARAEAFAYWANLYNAVTLDVVLDKYPIASIRQISSDGFFDPKAYGGPWRTKRVRVEGKDYSLDDIEHGVLRPTFGDPRVHYAVNCASFGCPNLQPKAWSAKSLETDLNAAARDFINHSRAVTMLPTDRPGLSAFLNSFKEPSTSRPLRVSSIFRWFREDFGGSDAGIIEHLRKYAAPDLAAALGPGVAISEDDYDWSLNDATRTTQ